MSLTKAVSYDLVLDIPIAALRDLVECPQDLDWEPLSPDDDADAALHGAWTSSPGSESDQSWCGLFASAFAHAALVALVFFLPVHMSTGGGNQGGQAVMVHLMRDDPSTPQEESPGSRDSAASAASMAERRRDAPDEQVKPLAKEPSRLDVTQEKELEESTRRVAKEREVDDEKRSKEEISALKDRQDVNSPNKSDSVNTIPSVASAPRVAIPAAGAEAADLRATVLSAIEEVAFFPKKALQKGRHGQVVVQFTIHREGSITGLALVKTSGSDELDHAALRIIERASEKFPHFPAHLSKESVSYEVPIVFKAASSRWN